MDNLDTLRCERQIQCARKREETPTPGTFDECAAAFAGPVCSTIEEAARRESTERDHDNGNLGESAFATSFRPTKIRMTPCR